MENNLKRILDIRFPVSSYSLDTKKEIQGIAVMTASVFKTYIALQEECFWLMPNTKILVINCANFKDEEYYLYKGIGNKKNGWISEVRVRMLEEDFVKLDEKGKMLLILDKIKEGFLKFVALFPEIDFDTQKIENAYQKIIDNDFYTRFTPSYFRKDNRYECWLEVLGANRKRRKQLVLNENNHLSKYFIAEEYWSENISDGYCFLDIMGKGWRGHKFYFRYGEEKIIFNADTKTVEYGK
ncbi:MAG: hypothetical protein Q4C98_11575 [Capnocytophaga sp.]|nr:hypothetical protein [Capnocytophaga sp.]